MSIERMKDKPHGEPRKLCWRYRDRSRGIALYFKTRAEAVAEQERDRANRRLTGLGYHTMVKDKQSYTARQIIHYYLSGKPIDYDEEEEIESNLPNNILRALRKQATKDIFSLDLHAFNRQVAEQFIEDMKTETFTTNGSNQEKVYQLATVSKMRFTLSQVWKTARRLPRLAQLENVWDEIIVRGGGGEKRQRGLKKGELERLIEYCEGCRKTNRYYVALAIRLAEATGMRRQEIVNLTWQDIDFQRRRIKIRKSKTDKMTGNKGREIVLPVTSLFMLSHLAVSLKTAGVLPGEGMKIIGGKKLLQGVRIPETFHPPYGKIFMNIHGEAMSGIALSGAFDDVVTRAGIEDLNFHDLRAAAKSEFYKSRLDPKEIDIMTNGPKGNYDVLEDYLETIQDKLDRSRFNGKTLEEMAKETDEEHMRIFRQGLKDGMSEQEATNLVIATKFSNFKSLLKSL